MIVGCDLVAQVEENVRLAQEVTPLSDRQLGTLGERTAPVAKQALFFHRWS